MRELASHTELKLLLVGGAGQDREYNRPPQSTLAGYLAKRTAETQRQKRNGGRNGLS